MMITNRTQLEHLLEHGDNGESILSNYDHDFSYNAVYIMADRYLIDGEDTDALKDTPIDWSNWPKVSGGVGGWLPEMYQIMPKGLLQNYFLWDGERKAREKAARGAAQ